MIRPILDSLAQPFFRRALLEAVLVGALAGVVGVHVLLRRLPFFVVAMSHATFPGVVLASMLGTSLFLGGSAFGLVVVVLLVVLGTNRALDDTSLIGVLLAGSFAVGIVLQSARSGGSKELSSFLVGSVLTVTSADLATTAVVGAILLLGLALTHKELVLTAFDPGAAAAGGYRLRLVELGILAAVTVALVTTVPVVGTLLAVAVLTVPALTARLWTDDIRTAMAVAAAVGAGSGIVGLAVSATYDIAAGGAIALTAAAVFAVSFVLTLPSTSRSSKGSSRQRRREPTSSCPSSETARLMLDDLDCAPGARGGGEPGVGGDQCGAEHLGQSHVEPVPGPDRRPELPHAVQEVLMGEALARPVPQVGYGLGRRGGVEAAHQVVAADHAHHLGVDDRGGGVVNITGQPAANRVSPSRVGHDVVEAGRVDDQHFKATRLGTHPKR